MWTTPRRIPHTWILFCTLLAFACGNDRSSERSLAPGGPQQTATALDPASALVVPRGMVAVRFREDPRAGRHISYEPGGVPVPVSVPLAPATDRDSRVTCLERWFLTPVDADTSGHDTVFAAIRRIAPRPEDPPGTSDVTFLLIARKRVVARIDYDTWMFAGQGLSPRRTISIRPIRAGERNALFVRTDSAGISGSERYSVFGYGPAGILQQFSGPVGHFRDADLPTSLKPGQVVYAHVQVAWFTVPLPLTYEPHRARFLPEVSDDAMFPASGNAAFQGDPEGSMLVRLFSSVDPGASSMSVPIPQRIEASARKAYLPSLVPGHPRGSAPGMVYISVGALEGWLPDSLFSRFVP